MKTSNRVLLALGISAALFIVIMIITYWRFQSVPDTLIQYTLGAGGIESLALASIKVAKTLKGDRPAESEEPDYERYSEEADLP